jgi:hypothetical protein
MKDLNEDRGCRHLRTPEALHQVALHSQAETTTAAHSVLLAQRAAHSSTQARGLRVAMPIPPREQGGRSECSIPNQAAGLRTVPASFGPGSLSMRRVLDYKPERSSRSMPRQELTLIHFSGTQVEQSPHSPAQSYVGEFDTNNAVYVVHTNHFFHPTKKQGIKEMS